MKTILLSLIIMFAFVLLSSNSFSQDKLPGLSLKNKNTICNPVYNKQIVMHSGIVLENPSSFELKAKPKSSGSGFGVRFGIGTDITLGIGFGAGAFYILAPSRYSSSPIWDLGMDIYYASVSEEDRDSEGTKFEENTKVLIFAFRSNALFNYHPSKTAVYFVAGAGFVLGSISWEENITYFAPYVPHTEHWSDDAFAVGNVLNLGVGMTFGGELEARFETPLLLFYSTPGRGDRSATSVAPTFTLSALYRLP